MTATQPAAHGMPDDGRLRMQAAMDRDWALVRDWAASLDAAQADALDRLMQSPPALARWMAANPRGAGDVAALARIALYQALFNAVNAFEE